VNLAAASSLSAETESKLSAEERHLYNSVHATSLAFKSSVLHK